MLCLTVEHDFARNRKLHTPGRPRGHVQGDGEGVFLRRPLDAEPAQRRREAALRSGETRGVWCYLPGLALGRGDGQTKDVVRERGGGTGAPAMRMACVCRVVVVATVATIPMRER